MDRIHVVRYHISYTVIMFLVQDQSQYTNIILIRRKNYNKKLHRFNNISHLISFFHYTYIDIIKFQYKEITLIKDKERQYFVPFCTVCTKNTNIDLSKAQQVFARLSTRLLYRFPYVFYYVKDQCHCFLDQWHSFLRNNYGCRHLV